MILFRSRYFFFKLSFGLFVFVLFHAAYAQDLAETLVAQVRAVQAAALAQSEAAFKINSNLQQVLERMAQTRIGEGAQIASADSFSTGWVQVDAQGRVLVALRVHEINSVLFEKLRELAFEIESSTRALQVSPRHQLVTGWAPFDKITALTSLPEIFHIRPVDRAMTQTGEVFTAGDAILRADIARANFNVTGAGWKVGVLSDGVNHLSTAQASADLPSNVQVINNRVGGDEGTALLEIIHDLAPGAALAFADVGLSEADFANNILLLRDAGAKIICDDVLYLLEPAFEDGLIAQTVEQVINDDVVYVSAAGNHELDHYEADFVSSDGDSYHEFSSAPMDETMNVTLSAGSTILLVLQWNNAFGRSADNYDLIVFDANSSTILARSTDVQNGDDDPMEYLEYRNSFFLPRTIQIAVSKVSGASRRFKLYTLGSGVTPTQFVGTTDGAIYGHAVATHALAIGAIDASDPGNDTIEAFSAHGPSRIYSYDNNGNPIAFEDRPKPDLIAIDGVQTKVGQAGFFANPFFGTSAAAPHAAGIAALLREIAPQKSALEINAALRSNAIDLGASGYDPIYGYGRVDAYAALTNSALSDLIPKKFAAPNNIEPGRSFKATNVVQNIGKAAAANFRLGFYLSIDSTITTADAFLDSRAVTGLDIGAIDSSNIALTMPASIVLRNYFLGMIVDDLESVEEMIASNNTRSLAVSIACVSDGDVNRDGVLSPGDALCAFELYLTNGVGPLSCEMTSLACAKQIADVNCDGVVTPGDALAIFQRYLQGQPPLSCFARSGSTVSNAASSTNTMPLQR